MAQTIRDENGRFVKGHPGGPGRPVKERCLSDLTMGELAKETTIEVRDSRGRKIKKKVTYMQIFVESQVRRAINGDAQAAKNVWDRIEGRVPLPIETTGELDITVLPPDEKKFV